jgi:hypothetical protein
MKVQQAELDLERLKPHLKASVFKNAARRWHSAAKLSSVSGEFRDKVRLAIIHLLIGTIAATHPVRHADKSEIEKSLRRARKVRRQIASACRLFGSRLGSAPRELERALLVSIWREATLGEAAVQLKQLRQGRRKYQAFDKFVSLAGDAYETASGKSAIVKIDYAHAVDEQYSGPFAELLETARADADTVWKIAGFRTSLDGPRDRNARLEYARKMTRVRRLPHARLG